MLPKIRLINISLFTFLKYTRNSSSSAVSSSKFLLSQTPSTSQIPENSLYITSNIITEHEEELLMHMLTPHLSKKRYQGNHWDDVITKYKEYELQQKDYTPEIQSIFNRIQDHIKTVVRSPLCFLPPHVIDLHANGYIGPHIDSIKFSGGIVSGLSLLSTRIMRLSLSLPPSNSFPLSHLSTNTTPSSSSLSSPSLSETKSLPSQIDILLPPRSLYILSNSCRYSYNHEILGKQPETLTKPHNKFNNLKSYQLVDVDKIENTKLTENKDNNSSDSVYYKTQTVLANNSNNIETNFNSIDIQRRLSIIFRDVHPNDKL
mmetsp:Transcript_22905/g.23135  ORF Transcript_22905/g.23135 Transcript_22905/m.23135 type:complete len:317 (+) Transcript_22905:333-1283(+)